MIKKIIDKLTRFFLNLYHSSSIKRMKNHGKNIYFGFGCKIHYPECIDIGDNVYINDYSWLSLSKYIFEDNKRIREVKPILKISNGTYIGRFSLISCVDNIFIGTNVMISDRCYIGDIEHSYKNLNLPIIKQPVVSKGSISIGDGSWIGVGVSILPGVKIGKHCVIGANSVVTINVPDYHIAAGNPAKIIKKINK